MRQIIQVGSRLCPILCLADEESEMLIVRIAIAVILSITVPFGLIWSLGPILHISAIHAAISQLPRGREVISALAYPLSAAIGFSFILRIRPYKTLEAPERQLIVGVAILYFPVICILMIYWTLSIGGGI